MRWTVQPERTVPRHGLMTDLYVRTDKPDLRILPDGLGSRGTVKRAELRKPTTADLVGAVRHLPNVEEVRRCVRHRADAWEPGDYCRPAWPDDIDDCVLISVLVVPLGGDDT